MIMDAVMYWPTPSMTMERFESPPPEKIFKRPRNWLLFRKASRRAASIEGMGTVARMRKTRSAPNTNRIRMRSVSSRKMISSFRTNVANICLRYSAARYFNRLLRACGKLASGDSKFFGKFTGREYLHFGYLTARCAHDARINEHFRIHSVAGCERPFELSKCDFESTRARIPHCTRTVLAVTAALRDLFDEIADLGALLVSRTSVLAFRAATRSLAALAAAAYRGLCARRISFECVETGHII